MNWAWAFLFPERAARGLVRESQIMVAADEVRLQKQLDVANQQLRALREEVRELSEVQTNQRVERREIALAPPPRRVPMGAAIATLFHGPLTTVGYLVLAASSILVWVFVLQSEIVVPFEFHGAKVRTEGIVTNIEYVGRSYLREDPVVAVHARFVDPRIAPEHLRYVQHGTLEAIGYGPRGLLNIDSKVEVVYVKANPHKAGISGLGHHKFPSAMGALLAFPLIGLFLVLPRFIAGIFELNLYRYGAIATGTLSQARPTGKSVNGVREMSYTFEFMPNLVIGDFIGEGRYTQITRVTHKGADAGRDTLEQVWETVLYLPERPATAYLIDELPGGTFVNAKGQFEAQPAKAWLHAVPPAAFLLVNVACAAVVSVAW